MNGFTRIAVAACVSFLMAMSAGCEQSDTMQTKKQSQFTASPRKNADSIQVWMAPRSWRSENIRELFSDDAQWSSVKKRISVFKFYSGFLMRGEDDLVARAVKTLTKEGIAIAVESPPVRVTPEQVKAMADRVAGFGGKLQYVDMDNGMGILMDAGWVGKTHQARKMEQAATADEAATEIADWVAKTKQIVPGLKVGMIECLWRYSFDEFPGTDPEKTFKDNNPCHGDLRQIMDMFLAKLAQRNTSIDFFHGEHARLQVMQIAEGEWVNKWAKLKRIEEYFKEKGIDFGILYADESTAWWWPDRITENENASFVNNVIKSVREHYENGGRVDHVVIQSWSRHPSEVLPEDEQYTFTYMVNQVLNLLEAKGIL